MTLHNAICQVLTRTMCLLIHPFEFLLAPMVRAGGSQKNIKCFWSSKWGCTLVISSLVPACIHMCRNNPYSGLLIFWMLTRCTNWLEHWGKKLPLKHWNALKMHLQPLETQASQTLRIMHLDPSNMFFIESESYHVRFLLSMSNQDHIISFLAVSILRTVQSGQIISCVHLSPFALCSTKMR